MSETTEQPTSDLPTHDLPAPDLLSSAELAAVAQVMSQAGTTPAGPLSATLIAGGKSNLTFRLSDGTQAWVMRTPPRAGRTPSAHDVMREFRVTSALGATDVPVAPAIVAHEGEELIGGPFAVCGFVTGRTIQSAEQLDELDDAQVASSVTALSRTLAALHAVDHVAIGLERFGRPDAYAERQLKRWSGQWDLIGDAFDEPTRAAAAALSTRLAAQLPGQYATGIVHGDYRIDNTLVDVQPGAVEVAAVVDWELSTIGDPVADVAMMCTYRNPVFDLVIGAPCAWTSDRLPDVDGLAAAYEAAGGVPLRDFSQHLALAHFKLAVIAAGIDHRYRAGATHGAGFDTARDSVLPLLESGLGHL